MPSIIARPPMGGSGIDVDKMVGKLVAADRAPKDKRLTVETQQAKREITAIGSLTSALDDFNRSLQPLDNGAVFDSRLAQSSNSDLFTASADSKAVAGHYSITVNALAGAQKLSSAAYAKPGTVVGAGSLTITVNGHALHITVDNDNNTLSAIRDAINDAPDNPGVTATIINARDGSHLQIASDETGVANAAHVVAKGDAGLRSFAASLRVISPASNAEITVDGYDKSSPDNSVSGIINDVTLQLKSASPNTSATLDVSRDTGKIVDAIKQFVDSYNNLASTMQKLSSYDASRGQGGPLLGDATMLRIESQLRRVMGNVVDAPDGSRHSLADIGITYQVNGKLSLDRGKLDNVLHTRYRTVKHLLGSDNGYASKLGTVLDAYLQSGGIMPSRTQALDHRLGDIRDSRQALDRRMETKAEHYRKKFSSLDSLVSNMRKTNNFINQQFGAMNRSDYGARG